MDYRREIDGLRALAVLPVIFFHAGFEIFSGGFVGVDVFFVISGFLITTIILAELEAGKFSLMNFYERRARRILPVLFFIMLLCLPFSWMLLIPEDMRRFSQSLVAVSAFASNILFWGTSGYFDSAAELKPLLHTWSLAVEEQYYLIFPVFLMFAWRLGKRFILSSLVLVFILSLALAQWASSAMPMAGFFLLPTRGWELLIGAFVAFYFANSKRKPSSKKKNEIGSFVGFILIIFAIFVFDKETPFPGIYALVPTVGAALIILYANGETFTGKILGSKIFVGVGLISYSAYLWHQPLLAFLRHKSFEDPGKLALSVCIGVTLILSYLSWRYIENPFRKKSIFSRRFIFTFAFVGSIFFTVVGISGHFTTGFPDRAMALPFKALEYETSRLGYVKCDDKELVAGAKINYCLQSKKGEINAVLIGDSHADDKFYGLGKNSKDLNWALIGNSSCPPVLDIDVEADQKGCREKFEKIISWVKKSPSIDTVVLSFYGNYALTSSFAADHIKRHTGPDTVKITSDGHKNFNRLDLFYYGLSQTVRALIPSGKEIVVLVDIPELPFFPLDCIKGRPNCEVSLSAVLVRQHEHRKTLDRLKDEFPSIYIYDPINLFCTDKICTYKAQQKILYRDSHHLTFDGSDLYAKDFLHWLSNLPMQE
ncbi:acyltransferase family protein [Janthinobacterium lividum]|uniref:acyltransferase family protein n=1 Tax=Janthinobacterium lividum TaxID=29581 RepID=UPI001409550A|nr:acyltransferase family protein [Janthinobacterium lividum]NHQ89637.1 acyltransferase [Janthinobacterium lividum]